MSNVVIAPTLETMAGVYGLSRNGGATSERFAAYVAQVPANWGLAPYNPMAGDSAQETVQQLLALNGEAVALETAQQVASMCGYDDAITLAIAVRSKGLWTDRVATEVDERVTGKARKPHHGIVSVWSREECARHDIVRETAAECVRVMWHAVHGVPDTLARVLACEGLGYAVAGSLGDAGEYGAPITPADSVAVFEALEVLGDTRQAGEIAGVLYGDEVAAQIGWTPLGIPRLAGYRWAVGRTRNDLANESAARVLRCDISG